MFSSSCWGGRESRKSPSSGSQRPGFVSPASEALLSGTQARGRQRHTTDLVLAHSCRCLLVCCLATFLTVSGCRLVLFTREASAEPTPQAPRSPKLKHEAGGAAAGASRAADYGGSPSGLRHYPRWPENLGPLR